MSKQEISVQQLIRSCRKRNQQSQERLYRLFYAYAMNICLHYANGREEAKEILNDGFYKAFVNLHQYDPKRSFKGWLRRVLINTAIDYHRKYNKAAPTLEIMPENEPASRALGFDQLAVDDLLGMIQQLPAMYRLVFNLHTLEGLKHYEIAERLGISIGASKSNLSRAKQKLRNMLQEEAQRTDLLKRGL